MNVSLLISWAMPCPLPGCRVSTASHWWLVCWAACLNTINDLV
jgi:hypothetical protein